MAAGSCTAMATAGSRLNRRRVRKYQRLAIPQEIAWRIFTKGIDRKTAEAQVEVRGDRDLGLHVLRMVTIVG